MTGSDRADRPVGRVADTGSVTPLILGMLACLLLLAAGLTAATSAFLGQQRLRAACDGAAVAGADAISAAPVTGNGPSDGPARDAVAAYLAVRSPGVSADVTVDGMTVTATCRTSTAITFGALFGARNLDQHVVSVASARL